MGIVVRSESEALWVQPRAGETITVPTAAIEKVEISRGRHSRKRGAALGAGVGAAAGLIATVAVAGSCDQSSAECGFGAGVTGFIYTPLAVALGALVGAAVPPSERWEEVKDDRPRVQVQPLVPRGGLGVALRVDF